MWWFGNAEDDVRIVLVVSIRKGPRTLRSRKVAVGATKRARPLTRSAILRLQHQRALSMPLLTTQKASTQQTFASQKIEVASNGVTGGPLILPFVALWGRTAWASESDVVLDAQSLFDFIRHF